MTPDHTRFADWDAAYVLGALTAADRGPYEEHLAACAQCRRTVAELAPTVGLLSRLSADDALALAGGEPSADAGEEEGPDASARGRLVSLAQERARRRRRTVWVAAAAAVVLVVAAVAVPVTIGALNRPTASFALEDVAGVPLEASVRLTDVSWGTRIDLQCAYPDVYSPNVPEGGWTYALAVVGTDGSDATVSTWRAGPGTSARLSAGSALPVSGIEAIEIRTAKGAVLMRYELGAASR